MRRRLWWIVRMDEGDTKLYPVGVVDITRRIRLWSKLLLSRAASRRVEAGRSVPLEECLYAEPRDNGRFVARASPSAVQLPGAGGGSRGGVNVNRRAGGGGVIALERGDMKMCPGRPLSNTHLPI